MMIHFSRQRVRWLFALSAILIFSTSLFINSGPVSAKGPKPTKPEPPTSTPQPTGIPQPTPIPTSTPTVGPFPSATPTSVITASPTPTQPPAPSTISIPFSQRPPQLDGACNPLEYFDALSVNFVDGNNTTGQVYFKHDLRNLYVCMVGAQGSYTQRFGSVYLDPNNHREPAPSPDELSLRIEVTSNTMSSMQGGSTGTFSAANLPGWTAAAQSGSVAGDLLSTSDQVEYQIPLSLVSPCGASFTLAVYHHWFSGPSNDYGWPQSQYWDVPSTWAEATLAGPSAATCVYLPAIHK